MSNRQLGWDDQRVRDRLSPREINEQEKDSLTQHESQEEQESHQSKDAVIESNPGSGSKGEK